MEGNSSCLSSFAYSIRYLWKTGTRELPTLACGQETASKSSSIGHWFHFKETGSGPHLLLHPPQSPPLPPCVRCALLFLHSAVAPTPTLCALCTSVPTLSCCGGRKAGGCRGAGCCGGRDPEASGAVRSVSRAGLGRKGHGRSPLRRRSRAGGGGRRPERG